MMAATMVLIGVMVCLTLGIGMVVVCDAARAPAIARELVAGGEQVETIGAVRAGTRGVVWDG